MMDEIQGVSQRISVTLLDSMSVSLILDSAPRSHDLMWLALVSSHLLFDGYDSPVSIDYRMKHGMDVMSEFTSLRTHCK